MNTIQEIALYIAIFASGMLLGYLMKVVMVNKENINRGINIAHRGESPQ